MPAPRRRRGLRERPLGAGEAGEPKKPGARACARARARRPWLPDNAAAASSSSPRTAPAGGVDNGGSHSSSHHRPGGGRIPPRHQLRAALPRPEPLGAGSAVSSRNGAGPTAGEGGARPARGKGGSPAFPERRRSRHEASALAFAVGHRWPSRGASGPRFPLGQLGWIPVPSVSAPGWKLWEEGATLLSILPKTFLTHVSPAEF